MLFSFLKKNDQKIEKLEEIIEDLQFLADDQKDTIEILELRMNSLESRIENLSDLMGENSSAIIEVNDKFQLSIDSHGQSIQSHENSLAFLSDTSSIERVESLSKMQRVIITWIIVLCATSIFSSLLYFKII
tara:strand:- start:1680 stop:2075 length:396 start_codon:yes stop_codon:yes gene_type:complete